MQGGGPAGKRPIRSSAPRPQRNPSRHRSSRHAVCSRRRPRPNLRVTSKARAPRTKAVAPRNASNQTGASTPAAASRPDTRPRRRARCMHRLLSLWRTWQRVWRRLRHSVWRRLRIHRACDPSASCDATDIGCFGRFDATDTSSGPCFAFVNRFPKKHRSLFADRLAPPRRRSRLGWFARWVHGCPHPPFPASQCVPPPPFRTYVFLSFSIIFAFFNYFFVLLIAVLLDMQRS